MKANRSFLIYAIGLAAAFVCIATAFCQMANTDRSSWSLLVAVAVVIVFVTDRLAARADRTGELDSEIER